MMNIAESSGESSCKGRENGDPSNESERPLKKARFAWQVKGKYHLKNELSEKSKNSTTASVEPDRACRSTENDSTTRGPEQNLEILGDYLLKQDFTLDSVIADSNKTLLAPSTSISNENIYYPRYVSSYDYNSSNNVHIVKSSSKTLSLVNNFAEDMCIDQWQARQMAKCFVDNTINHVLESWTQVPLPAEENSPRFLALDVAEFINNLPGDNSIENEGILMAISAHGLQNASSSSDNNTNTENSMSSAGTSDIPSLRSLSPRISDEETHDVVDSIQQCDTDESRNNLEWTCNDQEFRADDMTSISLFPEESSLTYQLYGGNHQNSNSQQFNGDGENHYDFLDTAVLFAIQSKGLTTFGTDYG